MMHTGLKKIEILAAMRPEVVNYLRNGVHRCVTVDKEENAA
jgi:hypothetical protein